jgi:hypothetical protein
VTVPAAGTSGLAAASRARKALATLSSCRTWPKVNERRNVPSVDGARPPVNSRFIPPCRSRSNVVDRVGAGDHSGDQRRHLHRGVDPSGVGHGELVGDQPGKSAALPQREDWRQPGARHQVRLVEHRRHLGCGTRKSHPPDTLLSRRSRPSTSPSFLL